MQFDYGPKNAAFVRQHGRCAKCGKYLNMVYEDRRGYEGAWTAHDLVPLEEGGSNRAHNCVILCITEPDCHGNFAHGGHLRERVFLTPYAFPNWVFRNGGDQDDTKAMDGQMQPLAQGTSSSGGPHGRPPTTPTSFMGSRAAAGIRPMSHSGVSRR